MKKKMIYSSVLTALLSVSSIALAGGPEIIPEPDYFSGFYLGGMGGVHHNTFNTNSSVQATQNVVFAPGLGIFFPSITLLNAGTIASTDASGGEYGGYGGIQGGFGKVFNHQFYIGMQGWGDWGSTSTTSTNTRVAPFAPVSFTVGVEQPATVTITPNASATTSTTTKISNDYGLAAKLGWVVAPRSMLYGKVGASWATISVNNSVNTSSGTNIAINNTTVFNSNTSFNGSSSSGDQNKVGLLLGVGFEQFVYQDIVSLNVEADYTNYGNVSTNPGQVTGSTVWSFPQLLPNNPLTFLRTPSVFTSANASSVQVSTLMAGLNFYFGRNWF